jgi:hypothetical protein
MRTSKQGIGAIGHTALLAIPVLLAVIAACSSGGSDDSASAGGGGGAGTTATTKPEDVQVEASDFTNLHDMTPVAGFFITNLMGKTDEAVRVAESADGGTYPVGTVIQLVPMEAMVKHVPGYNPDTNDWEFFTLQPTAQGTTILTRGGAEVVNTFSGLSCSQCHGAAESQFDFVCQHDHGCAPLPIGDDIIKGIQEADPRPRASATTTTAAG